MSNVMRSYDRPRGEEGRKRVVMSTRVRGEGSSEQGEERRKKRREEGERKKHEAWVESLRGRKVTCERQVCEHSLAENGYIQTIRDKGMAHFFKEVKGNVKAWVVDFFARMQYNDELEELETTIGSRTLVVTPDSIAEYLGYERPPPEAITYPRPGEEEMDLERIHAAVFEEGEDRGGGDLKDGFRTMNKVLHYKLFPQGMEKTPYDVELELLYVFMSVEECKDYAKWIFDQLVQFKQDFK